MSDDAATTTDPTQASDVGERRRAIQAERERTARSPLDEPPPPPPPTSLVRPYARITSPTGSIPTSGAGEDPDVGPQEDAVGEDVEVSGGESQDPADSEPAPRPEPSAPESSSSEASSPEPAPAEPAGWSLFTPVVPPEPPAYDDDVEPYPSVSASPSASTYSSPPPSELFPQDPAESPELFEPSVEPAAEDVPWPVPPAPEPRTEAGADEWAELSLRVGDDDAWLRALRRSLLAPGGGADLGPDPDEPATPEPVPPPLADGTDGDVRAEMVPDDVAPDDAIPRDVVPDDHVVSDDDDAPREDVLPVVPEEPVPAVDDRPPVTPSSPFRRPPADRLTRALSDDPAARPNTRSAEEADDDHEHVRGTLEPVLRHSTARAKITPVIRPPEPGEGDDGFGVVRAAPVSWADAMAENVVPSGKRGGRRLARARHESAGTEDYRPRPGADRSLTLLVLSMLLLLAVLVGLAVWAFWPRVIGARSVPSVSVTGMPAGDG